MSDPRLLGIRSYDDVVKYLKALLTDSRYFNTLAVLVILGDVVLTQLIIRFIAYTEIDWETYIYQLELYLKGERSYSLISGPTGPLVYPAGHVHIHHLLYSVTDSGTNVARAQQIYGALYVATLAMTCAIYGRAGGIPNWAVILLPLSKRLHSIFALRLFNDCWTVFLAQGAILAYGYGRDVGYGFGQDMVGTLLYSAAISVKMSALLYLPGVLLVIFRRYNIRGVAGHLSLIIGTQVIFGLPFLRHAEWEYLNGAFNFGHAFLYKWTVNWRFVDEDTFLSAPFARLLLAGHVGSLIVFGLFKWCRSDGGAFTLLKRGFQNRKQRKYSPALSIVSPDYVATVLMTSNLIGIIFARSLHYQFYSWYAQQLPFLAWRTKYPVVVKLAILAGIEYAWNVYPSTDISSSILLGGNVLLLLGIFFGYPEATEHWKQVYVALLSQLPLRNLHWKSSLRPNIRTIQELKVNVIQAETKRDEHTSQIPQSVLEKPLLNAYIVVCDDADTYKNTVKKQIRDWHATVAQRKNQEWLIIHVIRPDSKAASQKLFQIKTSVLDKIKGDFNMDKRDRCVQLVWSYDYDNPTAWAELINKVKEGILSAFETALTQREEEVKRSEGQRQMPGWNFCTFFILKESLALSFEGMSLYDEALNTYNELEALFFEVLKEKNLSWFGTLISPAPKDDSLPLLSTTKKPYRDLILASTIPIFDFRIYLLARQCIVLNSMHHIIEVAQKAVAFLGAFGRRLRDVEDSLPKFFVESWTYSSALSVVEQCDAWAKGLEFPKVAMANFNALKGELTELARHQLDIVGIKVGHLPSRPPFSIVLPSQSTKGATSPTSPIPDRSSQLITQADVLKSLDDVEAFYGLYVKITNRAIELYASAGRRKFALKMHGSLAALDVHRSRLSNALSTFSSLPAHYSPHGWTSLEACMLAQALDIHSALSKPRDRDWVYILLDFLKAYIQDLGKDLLLTELDHVAYVTNLVQALSDAARDAPSEMIHHDHPAITVSVPSGRATLAETRDGAILNVVIRNSLPCPIPISEVTVSLSGRDGSKIQFFEKLQSLEPGENTISLFCHSASAGTYSLHSAQIKMSNLVLQWTHSPPPSGKSRAAKRPPVLIQVPKDLHAVDVRLRQPQRIQLAIIKLSAPSGVQFKYSKASIIEPGHAHLETSDDSVALSEVSSSESVSISMPHSDASAYHAMRVNITVEYTTTAEPEVIRTLQLVRFVLTALPVSINVEDFFRGTRLFTRFTLTSTSPQHVRILSTELASQGKGDDGLKIAKCMSPGPRLITITPAQPGRFLFRLDSARGEERNSLHLKVTYRMLREEVEQVMETVVGEVVTKTESLEPFRAEILDTLVQALEKDASWVSLYEITGELVIPDITIEEDAVGQALEEIKKLLNQSRRLEDFPCEWREIVIPVDVPQMHILAAASLQISSNPFSLDPTRALDMFAGQPIHAVLTIRTSFHWAPTEDSDTESYRMRFDIEEMSKDWLVSGRKRGDFIAEDNHTFTTSITLIALHHGELPLPKISVTALAIPGEQRMKAPVLPSCETYQIYGAQTVLVLPRGGRSTFIVNMGESA
ncbi:hypothetical protein EUX98_g4553 [Antrodiella citrinella]|uniref:Uncharacterized protein n=1 Tax=Antrodiella citrinella TaxID=2447956 RepID=A0A4S4MTV1_9APHY|nr:hypothetical protein EUX98_g4553 [Antrodiella citrinella]